MFEFKYVYFTVNYRYFRQMQKNFQIIVNMSSYTLRL